MKKKSKLYSYAIASLLTLTTVSGLLYSSNVNATAAPRQSMSKFTQQEENTLREIVNTFESILNSYEDYEDVLQDYSFPGRTIRDVIAKCQSIQRENRYMRSWCNEYTQIFDQFVPKPVRKFDNLANIMENMKISYDIGLNLPSLE